MLDSSRRLRMDGQTPSISPDTLYAQFGTAAAPVVLDCRRPIEFEADNTVIIGAVCQTPDAAPHWLKDLRAGRQIVVYCADGGDVSQVQAATLAKTGASVAYLAHGIAGWRDLRLPTRQKFNAPTDKWVTRAKPKIDRIACPWLIRRFIDPYAEFLYVPPSDVLPTAARLGAVPYDIEGVAFSHEGDRCSFDTFLRIYGIADPALDRLAAIVRGADTSRHDLAPQCGGLFAISLGLSANFPNDHDMLAHGMVMYDALYTWCRSLQSETHNWPAKTPAVAQSAGA
jgi:rhodanese-related sulfurtransferase